MNKPTHLTLSGWPGAVSIASYRSGDPLVFYAALWPISVLGFHTNNHNLVRNKPTVPLPTDEAGHTPHSGSEKPAAQTKETTQRAKGRPT